MKYAVAILSGFDNDNKILFIDSNSKSNALKTALVELCTNEETMKQQKEWNEVLPDNYEDLVNEIANGELFCCVEKVDAT